LKAIDARARKILFDTFWTSKGWTDRDARAIPAADRAYAMAHGMMFERVDVQHDALLADLHRAWGVVSLEVAAGHFLASLSTRRLDLRSGLASRCLAERLPTHAFTRGSSKVCAVCAGHQRNADADLDVLQFERHKWGGVRHGDVLYGWFDLSRLVEEEPATPTDEDRGIFAKVLEAAARAAPKDTPGKLSQALKDVLPSTKQERDQLVEILAAAGVLVASDPGLGSGEFVHAGAWRGADGYDRARVARLFGAHGVVVI
jgi:hypothetical protein